MRPPLPFEIITPTLVEADGSASVAAKELLQLRVSVFKEELETAGVPVLSIEKHTADWLDYPDEFAHTIKTKMERPETCIRAALLGKKVVGYFSGQIVETEGGVPVHKEVNVIQLLPEARRRGLGGWFLRYFTEQQFNISVPTNKLPVKLTSITNNDPAQQFYKNQGFVELPTTEPEYFTIDDTYVPVRRLVKP